MDLPAIGRRIAFSLIPVSVVMGAAECGLRMADWPTVEGAFEHNAIYWLTDPSLVEDPTEHKERSSAGEQVTFPISTDSSGLRWPIHEMSRPDNTFRILTMGCSTTFGWGVADDQSYPAQLEALIHQSGHTDVEVINGGQPGYTSFQGLWLWDEVLRFYEPDLVLVGYVVQDARDAAYTDRSQAILEGDVDFMKRNTLYKSKVYLALRSILGKVQIRLKECDRADQKCDQRVPTGDYAANLRSLVEKIQDVGATPVIFGYPLEVGGYTNEHRLILRAAADELEVPHLELQPEMEQAARAAKEESVYFYFPEDPGHATADGNGWIAEKVFSWLQQNHWLEAG
jgi:lysophospholipase L1-like esterase